MFMWGGSASDSLTVHGRRAKGRPDLWSIPAQRSTISMYRCNHNDISIFNYICSPSIRATQNRVYYVHSCDARAHPNRICIISHLIFAKYVSIWLTHSNTQFIPIDLNVMLVARACVCVYVFARTALLFAVVVAAAAAATSTITLDASLGSI